MRGSSNAQAGDASNKQDKLTFDTVPTSGSTNPVTSDGIQSYVESQKELLEKALGEQLVQIKVIASSENLVTTSTTSPSAYSIMGSGGYIAVVVVGKTGVYVFSGKYSSSSNNPISNLTTSSKWVKVINEEMW